MGSCRLCWRKREEEGEYCSYHKKAHKHLQEAYEVWKIATGIDWINYLCEISEIKGTGEWVQEVVRDQLDRN